MYEDIKDFNQRCEEHPDHQSGMVNESMLKERLHEEIDELRAYIENDVTQRGEFAGVRVWLGSMVTQIVVPKCAIENSVRGAELNDAFKQCLKYLGVN